MSASQQTMSEQLQAWLRFIRSESHILRTEPALLIQQAANQPDDSVVAIAARKFCDDGSVNRPWIKWVNKPQDRDPCTLTLSGHTNEVEACCYSPDGRHILSGSKDETLKVWDAETGELVETLEAHSGPVTCCAYFPDGQRLVARSKQGELSVWDAHSFELSITLSAHSHTLVELLRIGVPSRVIKCSIARDGSRLLSRESDDTVCLLDSCSGSLLATLHGVGWETPLTDNTGHSETDRRLYRIWNGATGELLATLRRSVDAPESATYSPSADRIALAVEGKLEVWDAKSGVLITEIKGIGAVVTACCFSPYGHQILSSSTHEGLRIWDSETGLLLATLSVEGAPADKCCYSADGRFVVSCSGQGTISVWEASDHVTLASWKNHSSWKDAGSEVSRTPTEKARKVLADAGRRCSWEVPSNSDLFPGRSNCGSSDGTVKIWDSSSGTLVAKLEASRDRAKRINSCCYSSDGRLTVIGSGAGLEVFDNETGELLENPSAGVIRARFSPDNHRIVLLRRFESGPCVWDREAGELVLELTGHTADVTDCCLSPDGRRIVSASDDQTLIIWDSENGGQLARLEGHTGRVRACCYSPDGSRILSGGEDKTLRIWEAETGALLQTIECSSYEKTEYISDSEEVTACCYSPDGGHFASGSRSGSLKVWDEAGTLITNLKRDFRDSDVSVCCFSPDGRRILSGSYWTLKIWDVETGVLLKTLEGHTDTISGCCYSPDGRRILSSSWDGSLKIWDAETGSQLGTLRNHGWMATTYDDSPEGALLVTESDFENHLTVRDENGEPLARLEGTAFYLNSCCYDPKSGQLILNAFGESGVFDARTGRRLVTLGDETDAEVACCYSLDGCQIITKSKDNSVTVRDAETGRSLAMLDGRCFSVAIGESHSDGPRLVTKSADGMISVFDADSGALLARFEQQNWPAHSGVYSPNGQLFAAVSTSTVKGGVEVRETSTDSLRGSLAGHSGVITTACFSPDGNRLVTASSDKTLKVWDLENAVPFSRRASHSDEVTTMRFAPDSGRLVSGSKDNTLKVWNLADGELAVTLSGHAKQVTTCTYSTDGRRILSGSEDNQLILWDAEDGSLLRSISWHTSEIRACCYSPDGSRVVSGSSDATLAIWDAELESLQAKLDGKVSGLTTCCYSPDGRQIVVGHSGGALTVWDAVTHRCLARLQEHRDAIDSCHYLPDGRRFVSASWDGTINIWDATGNRLLATLGEAPDEYSPFYLNKASCAISPDGRRILSGHWDGTVRLWDSRTGALLGLVQGARPDWIVTRCWFSPNGQYLITVEGVPGVTGELNVRDGESRESRARFHTQEGVEAAALSDDGLMVSLGDRFGDVSILRLMSFEMSAPLVTAVYLCRNSKTASAIPRFVSGLLPRAVERALHKGGTWSDQPTAKCKWCGNWFVPSEAVLQAITDISRMPDRSSDHSSCVDMPTESWADPRLESSCTQCGNPVRFNPFIVDNRHREAP